jgi:L-alanine-DL-glutamate epimerase-like enolase superfamily enzyme
MDLAAKHGRKLAPHFAMEVHLHLAAAYPLEPWLEHFEWLNPLFNEQLELRDGRMWVSERHGLGFTLSEQARRWTQQSCEFGNARNDFSRMTASTPYPGYRSADH